MMPGILDSFAAAGQLSTAVLQYGPEIGKRAAVAGLGGLISCAGLLFVVSGSKTAKTVGKGVLGTAASVVAPESIPVRQAAAAGAGSA